MPARPTGSTRPARSVRVRADDGAWLAAQVHEPRTADRPTVVLVHGWVSTHTSWAAVVEPLLRAGVAVVTYDHRAHGASQAHGPGRLRQPAASVRQLGDDLAAVLRAVAPEGELVVAGHSLGGMAVLAWAGGHLAAVADRLRGVALVSTAAERPGYAYPRAELLLAALCARIPGLRVGPFFGDGRQQSLAFTPGTDLATVQAARALVASSAVSTFGRYHRAMRRHDEVAALQALRDVPVDVLVGELDRLTPVRQSEQLAETLPHARFEVLPGLGHMLCWEAPDVVAEHLLDLAGHPVRR
ncbi:alpha/beta fold hydrolase [Angustibacter aerolatus]